MQELYLNVVRVSEFLHSKIYGKYILKLCLGRTLTFNFNFGEKVFAEL